MKVAIGRLECGRHIRAGVSQRAIRWMCLLTVAGVCLVLAPTAAASFPSFTWDGGSSAEEWEANANWVGGVAPTDGEEIGALTFPRLTSPACEAEQETEACYFSFNNVSGLSAQSLEIDDGNDYVIGGNAITLGAGGLSSSPTLTPSELTLAFVALPLLLGAEQTWQIRGAGREHVDESQLYLAGGVTGSNDKLKIELGSGGGLDLGGTSDNEVGPLTIEGTEPSQPGVFNGVVSLFGGKLNSSDVQPVSLGHLLFYGAGTLGPLSSEDSELDIASGEGPGEGTLDVTSATLDASSHLEFEISGAGLTAGKDYSWLTSAGTVALGGSTIAVHVTNTCPLLRVGQTYTLVSTSGTLMGAFANAPEHGQEIPIEFAKGCSEQSHKIRIAYHETGGTQTVTGTVEAEAKEQQEAAERKQREEETKRQEEETKRREEEAKKREEETKRHEEEAKKREAEKAFSSSSSSASSTLAPAATQEVAGFQAAAPPLVPDAQLAGTALEASLSGIVSVKVSCLAGESCSGTVRLRTLNAVVASLASAAKSKGSILTLATGSFTVAGGKVTTVKLHLSAKARALLARLHVLRARATIVAHDPAGASHTTQIVVTLRVAKARHGKA
jgi:hypothetical protein